MADQAKEHLGADPFAEIALREHPLAGNGLEAIKPRVWERRMFAQGTEAAVRLPKLTYEKQLEQFQLELDTLRAYYRPYLRRLTPAAEFARPRQELRAFDFRYEEEQDAAFSRVLAGLGEWEQVTVPDFRGPTKEKGRWTGYYRTTFSSSRPASGKRVFVVFKGVDYKAIVYVNGKCVGSHEGLFAPFECDITSVLQEENVLVVEVHNDYPMMGVNGSRLDGDKMYAATGPGWDEPIDGWHHCPPGGGIYNRVIVEERAELFVQDIFVRTNPEEAKFEAWVDVTNATDGLIEHAELRLQVYADNFDGEGLSEIRFPVAYAGPGLNNYRYTIAFPFFQSWELEMPRLYTLRVSVFRGEVCTDVHERCFGMRSFHMDESAEPKGTLYFNNRPIMLRGANEMGHLQLCVMKDDHDQLVDDILIAKLANLNFYRVTQRPVQEEIYDCMDRLGMLNQCDLPAFGYIRRSQFCEAVRQTAEMERLVRGHPSVIMVSLINEPSRPAKRGKGHRHLFRDEMEAFFTAARQAIYMENPDRVVKNAEGDYDPPTAEGLSDFHCYTMWYTNHMIPFGELYKGGLPPIKAGWKTGCGEYGSEGLDRLDLMQARYPRVWLPEKLSDRWMPNAIVDAQSYALHGDWYPEPSSIEDWIRVSQRYQAFVTKLMTDVIRRRSDCIVQSAVHLLIDAWPSGWMKSLVGVDRVPKPAYFTYAESMEPVRVHLRGDRWRAYAGEVVELEAWLLNDTPAAYNDCRIIVTLRDDGSDIASFSIDARVEAVSSCYSGTLALVMPDTDGRRTVYAEACLLNASGQVLNGEQFEIEVFARRDASDAQSHIAYIGEKAKQLCSERQWIAISYSSKIDCDTILISSSESFRTHETEIRKRVEAGATAVFLSDENGHGQWRIGGEDVKEEKTGALFTLACDESLSGLIGTAPSDFSYFFNRATDRIDPLTGCGWRSEGVTPLLYTYEKPSLGKSPAPTSAGKPKIAVVGTRKLGSGSLVFIGLELEGRIGCNPPLDRLLASLVSGKQTE
ncbi:glycosyl hydrolase 2 galactose-binding domain-containing protein [Paenibacillus ferrarius]|uniref:glycosyl hydrolase 2 galactose-binding domain-containing protein n=1 Tax=Paenibacillus ferrarius TaxID=1469647 RepID=UPI003D2E9490